MKTIKYLFLSVVTIGFMACENDTVNDLRARNAQDPDPVYEDLTAGSADFSKYVAVGASFTAGFTDGGLFMAGQEDSFPNTLSKQFMHANGGTFTQPLMSDNTGGILVLGNAVSSYRLVFNGSGPQPLDSFLTGLGAPVPPITTEATSSVGSNFNNFGIPGAKSFHMVTPGYAAFNPFYTRMASGATSTVLGDAAAQNPTFFTLSEMGGNDVLGYATSGGTGVDQTGNTNPLTYGVNDITDPNVLASAVNTMVTTLTANGAKGLITNVPYITSLPHFTTVPHNPVPLDAATAGLLNQGYATYNGGLQAAVTAGALSAEEATKRTINFSASANNAMVIVDEDLTDLSALGIPSYRQATSEDLFVLPLSSLIPSGYGTQIPLADQWVLIPSEQMAIKNATDAYNATIANIASSNANVGLVDLNAILTQASSTGVEFDDYVLTTDLVTGGLVSLDGIHLTARGYALMANKFLEAIDANFGSNFVASGTLAKAEDFRVTYSAMLP